MDSSMDGVDNSVEELLRHLTAKNEEVKRKLRAAISQRDEMINEFQQLIENDKASTNGDEEQFVQHEDSDIEELRRELAAKEDQVKAKLRAIISARDNTIETIDQQLGGIEENRKHLNNDLHKDKNPLIEKLKLELEQAKNEHVLTERSLRVVISAKQKDLEVEREKLTETISELKLTKKELQSEKTKNDQLNLKLEELSRKISDMAHEDTLRMGVANISTIAENVNISSNPLKIAGLSWNISLYKKKKNDVDYLSVFLYCDDFDEDEDLPCTVICKLRLIALDNKSKNLEKCFNYTYNEETSRGYSTFITWKDLLDESKGYVKDDSIVLESALRVYPQAEP